MRGQLLLAAGLLTAVFAISFPTQAAPQKESKPLIETPSNKTAANKTKEVKLDTPNVANVNTTAPARIFDADHRDYHLWDDNEQRAYQRFWEIQHRKFRDFSKINAREVSHYWTWRHSHPGRIAVRQ